MQSDFACPIFPTYRTTNYAIGLRLSDSSYLSDNQLCDRTSLVRFFPLIGHPAMQSDFACPIFPTYRTTNYAIGLRLSDSSYLSDNQLCDRTSLVRFFPLIGHPAMQSDFACPIFPTYRTTNYAIGLRLSDSSYLSDIRQYATPKKQGLSANETILVSTFLSMQFVAYVVFHIAGFVLQIGEQIQCRFFPIACSVHDTQEAVDFIISQILDCPQ